MAGELMTADPPCVLIRVELERDVPVLEYRFRDTGEKLRLLDWLGQRVELAALIGRAVELAEGTARR